MFMHYCGWCWTESTTGKADFFFFLFCKGFIFGSEQEGLKSAGINLIKNTEHFSLFLFLFVFSSLVGYSQALENYAPKMTF